MGRSASVVSRRKLPFSLGIPLIGGKGLFYGKKVAESGSRTLRLWSPNLQDKHIFSVALNRPVFVQTTSSVLRTIKKLGGLDQYLFKTPPEKLGESGLYLQRSVKAAHQERKARGIKPNEILDPRWKAMQDAMLQKRQKKALEPEA